MFIIKWNKSVIITYLGIICGVVAMYFAFTQMAFSKDVSYLRYSLIFLVLAGVCDMFDGKVARMCKRTNEEKQFGIELDSLADTVNFICLPVVIMLSLGMYSLIDIIIYVIFVLCGISRLSFFNVNASLDSPVKYYKGLPVTSTAIIYPILGILHGKIDDSVFFTLYIVATAITAFLFIFNFKCPKLKGKAYVVIPILATILVALLVIIR